MLLAGGAGCCAGIAQAAKALDQHWRGLERILAIDQIIENLIVTRCAEVEELLDCALFSSSKAPPAAFEFKDTEFEVAQSGACIHRALIAL